MAAVIANTRCASGEIEIGITSTLMPARRQASVMTKVGWLDVTDVAELDIAIHRYSRPINGQ